MHTANARFLIVGCTTPQPASMPMDPDGSLRQQSEAVGEDRLRTSLDRHLSDHDSYVRIEVPGVDENGKSKMIASTKAVTNRNRWTCGAEAAATVLNTIGVDRALAMIQAPATESRQMVNYLAEVLAPMAPTPVGPQVTQNMERAPAARSRVKLTPELNRR